jgi:hypothetical protein
MSQTNTLSPSASHAREMPLNAFSLLLLVNAVALGLTGLVQGAFDLAGYFLNKGPLASALHGNLDSLAFFEAHGLALIVGILLMQYRYSHGARWHWVASATHTLLGGSNLMFWPIFAHYDLVPMGIVATAMHVFFAVTQFAAACLRAR